MAGYLEDKDGNKSSKRLNQTIIVFGGLFIGIFSIVMANLKTQPDNIIDIGPNIMYLIIGLVGLGVGAGVGTAFSNKKPK